MPEHVAFIAETASGLLAGILLGLVHFLSLRSNVRYLLKGRPLSSLVLQLARFALTGGALVFAARWFGAMPLLAVTTGVTIARSWLLGLEPQWR